MGQPNSRETKWLSDVQEHDYPAAESYLDLIYPEEPSGAFKHSCWAMTDALRTA